MYTAIFYISVMCTKVKDTEGIYTEVMYITDYRHVHNSHENWSLLDSVLCNADTVAKDTVVLYIVIVYTAVMHTAVIYTVDNYT